MRARGLGDPARARHAGDLADPLVAVDRLDLRDRPGPTPALRNPVMGLGQGRNLRQVGDDNGLVRGGQLL